MLMAVGVLVLAACSSTEASVEQTATEPSVVGRDVNLPEPGVADPTEVRVENGLLYRNQLSLDVYSPAGDVPTVPTVVLVPDAGVDPTEYGVLGSQLAAAGLVVFVPLLGEVDQLGDLDCAVRTVQELSAVYGGDATQLAYVGHGSAASLSVRLGLRPSTSEAQPIDGCTSSKVVVQPQSIVTVDGRFGPLYSSGFSGTADGLGEVVEMGGNIYVRVRVLVPSEATDPATPILEAALRAEGYDVAVDTIGGFSEFPAAGSATTAVADAVVAAVAGLVPE